MFNTKQTILVLLISLLLILTSCGSINSSGDYYYTFTDDLNIEIKLRNKPVRVAVIFSSYAEVWNIAGGSIDITVGETIERGFVRDAELVDSGAGKNINIETLISLKPDFVICSSDIPSQKEAAFLLNNIGISAACFKVETFDDYLRMLKICTDITGNSSAYTEYGLKVKEEIDSILKEANVINKKILFIRASSTAKSTKAKNAKQHFVAAMLAEFGVKNIADEARVLLDGLSIEEIVLRDPDYIFISTMGDEVSAINYMESLFQENIWKDLTAIKNNKYCYLPKELFQFKPNHRWINAYSYLLEVLNED